MSQEELETARALARQGHLPQAQNAYRRFLEVKPDHPGAWADLGGVLMQLDHLDEAVEACEKALGIDADHSGALVGLGSTRIKQGRLAEAEGLLRRALNLDPQRLDARINLAECLVQMDDFRGAIENLQRVLEREPEHFLAFTKVLFAQHRLGDWRATGAAIDCRLKAAPGCPQAEVERGLWNLLQGQMPLWWDHYEARFRIATQVSVTCPFSEPLWGGEPFPDKTLLLHWEQGYGDMLMFIRFASLAKARGGRVVVLAQPSLADLLATCPGVEKVVPHGDPLPPFDLQLPIMSLPRVFRTDLASIPAEVPYLAIPDRVPNREWIAQVLAASEGRVRVGYAWAGRADYPNDFERSVPASLLAPLKALPGIAWHSFQVPPREPNPLPSVSLSPLLSNFSDTAYALSGMDLVITVDTSLAHAAGALGIPTLLMLPYYPDWRWLLERTDSPWYPTMRLYRQPRPGDWESVIRDLLADLAQN